MPVPILKQGNVLVASVQDALTDKQMLEFRASLVELVGEHRALAVLIDVSGLDVIDSFTARTLQDLTHTVRLRGARSIVVGIQPQVAFAMVQLGLFLEDVTTALDLEAGLQWLDLSGAERHG